MGVVTLTRDVSNDYSTIWSWSPIGSGDCDHWEVIVLFKLSPMQWINVLMDS